MKFQQSYLKILKDDAIKVLHSICQQIWKTQQWPQDWKKSVYISIPKKGSTKECSNHWIIALISHTSKVMLKILLARLQHYVNQEFPDSGHWSCQIQRQKVEWWLPGSGVGEMGHGCLMGTEFQFGKMKKVLEMVGGEGSRI